MKWFSINYWIENYILSALKKFLDKGGAGWKTIAGLFLLILSAAVEACSGSYCEALKYAYEIAKQLPFDPIQDSGIVLLISGLVHKMLNFAPKK